MVRDATTRMLKRLPTGLSQSETGTNAKVLEIPASEVENSEVRIDDLELQRFVITATGAGLDRFARMVQLGRLTGESDVQLRIRVLAEYRRLFSGGTRNEIIAFIAQAVNADPSEVVITENKDNVTGLRRSRYYYAEVPIAGLVAQGIEDQTEIDAIFALVGSLLDRVEVAGVKGAFKILGNFSYAGDGGDLGPATGTAATGYWNTAATPDYGSPNEGGYWGGFT